MSTAEPTPWYQKNWAKTLTWLVPIAAFCLVVYRYIAEPTTEVSATYSVSAFELPDYLKHTTKSDTIILGQAAFIRRLNRAYSGKLTFKEELSRPDSLNPFKDKYAYTSDLSPQIQRFALDYHGFATLSVKNEGQKLVKQFQILHEAPVYYEYKDSNGKIQAGHSETKFAIGELSPTEKREITLWFANRYRIGEKGIVVTYDDGRVVAEQAVEVMGKAAWLVQNAYLGWPLFIGLLMTILLISAPALLSRRQRA